MGRTERPEKIRCDACPVLCYIADGKSGACDRYANNNGELIRLDPLTIIENSLENGAKAVPFMKDSDGNDWDGDIIQSLRPWAAARRLRAPRPRLARP